MVAVPEDFDRGFEEAYRAHYPALRRRSRRWLPADEVDDAVQETFLRAWAHHGGRDPGMGWLVTVLRNLAIDRARRRTAEPVGDIEKLDSPTDEGPDDKVVALEERRAVRQAMLDLTESQRTVLHLREWDGKSHQEIADSLGTTIPSVESLLVRGRRRLRGALEKVMGVVLWPASGAWRKLRGLPEAGAGAAVNPVAVGAVSTAVAHFATAAAVIVAGVAGGGGSGRGEEREPIRPSEGYTAAVAGGSEQVGSRRGASAGFTRETSSTKETARGSTSGGGSTASTETSTTSGSGSGSTTTAPTEGKGTSKTELASPEAPQTGSEIAAPGDTGTTSGGTGNPETPGPGGTKIDTGATSIAPSA